MKIINIIVYLFVSTSLNAFSTTNIQILYGAFDGNSYIYDTKNGSKTTVTVENFSANNIGSIYAFVDYAIADDKFKYHNDKNDLYGEIAPRLSLGYLTNSDLSFLFVKDIYAVGEYNRDQTTKYEAFLYGLGADFNIYGFDNFGLNLYKKYQNIGSDTIQLTGFYSSQIMKSDFSFTGYFDWTELDFTTQNQFLYNFYRTNDLQKTYVGVEWIIFNEKPSIENFNTYVESSTLQIMLKHEW